MAVNGPYASVADGQWGLTVIDLSRLFRPRITHLTCSGNSMTVHHTNTFAGTN
jgi:hypothetical protein